MKASSRACTNSTVRIWRRAASRGFWVAGSVPYGFSKVMVQDWAKKRPTLEPDPATAPVMERIFDMAESGKGILDIARALNDEGIANPRGKRRQKTTVRNTLSNEACTGAVVWRTTAKDSQPPVRMENAYPAIIYKGEFQRVGRLLKSRALKKANPREVSSPYLLGGILKCEAGGKAMTAAEAKGGKYTYCAASP